MATTTETRSSDGIGWITLNGDDRLNAIGSSTYAGLASAVRDFEQDEGIGVVVIHGAGRCFSAGADIGEIADFDTKEQFSSFIHGFTDALDVLAASRLPIIAAIHGAALGGGLELAMACDIRLATPDAKLGLPESKLGVLPGGGGTQRLPGLVPLGVATAMLMSGASIAGRRAYELGLVSHLAASGDHLSEAEALATSLREIAPQVFTATKSLLRSSASMSLADGIDVERDVTSDLFDSADGREGFAAFRERRPAKFGGARR